MKRFFWVILIFLLTYFSLGIKINADGNYQNLTGPIQTSPTLSAVYPSTKGNLDNSAVNKRNVDDGENDWIAIFKDSIKNLIWATFGGFIGAFITVLLTDYQKPHLDIIAVEDANSDNTYQPPHMFAGRWKFFRVFVINKPINKYLRRFISRETAQSVNAFITFHGIDQTMKGRWAGTIELVQANPNDYARIINFPEPKNLISGGTKEQLDVFTKYENDVEAYGWNNEAYVNNWRTPRLELIPGDYNIDIEVIALDGTQLKKTFTAHIDDRIENTYLR